MAKRNSGTMADTNMVRALRTFDAWMEDRETYERDAATVRVRTETPLGMGGRVAACPTLDAYDAA